MDHRCFCVLLFSCFQVCSLLPCGKGLTSWLLLVMFIVFLIVSHGYPGSGVVLDCIVSRSLPFFLLSNGIKLNDFDDGVCSLSLL